MYHARIQIHLFSCPLDMIPMIKEISPLDGFSHTVLTHTTAFDGILSQDDIVLCTSLAQWKDCINKGAYIIFIQKERENCEIDEIVDEIWHMPVSAAYVKKRMYHILQEKKMRKDVQQTMTYLDTLIDSVPDLIWFKDNEGRHEKVNTAFCHTVGKQRGDITGKDHCAVWDVETNDCEETEQIVRKERKTCLFHEIVQSRHGKRQFRTYKTPLFDEKGHIMGTVGMGHDITDLENMSTEMDIVLASMPFAILVKDVADHIINVNTKFEEYFEVAKNQLIGEDYETWRKAHIHEDKSINNQHFRAFVSQQKQDRILEINEEEIFDIFHQSVGKLCIYRDVTREFLLEQQILYTSNTDFLTNLCNRRYFYEYIFKHRGEEQISMLYVDLDHFKMVNDTYGHQVGDEALVLVAQVLQKCFPNDLITRLGGDEFLITMMRECSEQKLCMYAEQLLETLQKEFAARNEFAVLSASIGIAYTSDPQKKIDEVIKESDAALYRAKQSGRSCYCLYESHKGVCL